MSCCSYKSKPVSSCQSTPPTCHNKYLNIISWTVLLNSICICGMCIKSIVCLIQINLKWKYSTIFVILLSVIHFALKCLRTDLSLSRDSAYLGSAALTGCELLSKLIFLSFFFSLITWNIKIRQLLKSSPVPPDSMISILCLCLCLFSFS